MQIGTKIKELRISKNLSQSQFAKGIASVSLLSKIENNQRRPSDSFLNKLSQKLELDIKFILNDNRESFEDKIHDIFLRAMNDQFSEEDLLLLEIQKFESHRLEIYLEIYSVLLRFHLLQGHYEKAKVVLEQSKNVIPDCFNDQDQFLSQYQYLLQSAKVYISHQNYYIAHEYLLYCEKLLAYVSKQESAKFLLCMCLVKSNLFEDKSISLYYAERALRLVENSQYYELILDAKTMVAIQYISLEKYVTSRTILNECLEMAKILGLEEKEAIIYYHLGRGYYLTKQLEVAIEYYLKAIKLNQRYKEVRNLVECYKGLLEAYFMKKERLHIESYLSEAISVASKHNLNLLYMELSHMRANLEKERHDYPSYEKQMRNLIEESIRLNQISLARKAASELGKYYYNKGAYKKASHYLLMVLNNY